MVRYKKSMNNKVQKLEDLVAWSEAKALAVDVYKLTAVEPWSKDFGLRDQIRRSAVSISSNIAEGYGRGGNKEFVQFLYIAKGSLYELKTQLIIGSEIGYSKPEQLSLIFERIDKTSRILAGLLNYIKESEYKGSKFAEPIVEYTTTSNFELGTSN